jgi:hypothetical protein
MPCNSQYLEPTAREKESAKLLVLLREIGIHSDKIPYYGFPEYLDECTRILCDYCQTAKMSTESLELQIWWRDHQIADKARLEKELRESEEDKAKRKALEKLTHYEKGLLGL